VISTIKAFIIAPLIFLIVLAAIFAYSGIWPPMVVVESESMQHSDTTSYIGVIDTGDIVVVKRVDQIQEVTTYVEGVASGYSTYGEPGDVIIYDRPGMAKPIIHRAIVNLEYNLTGGGFDIPSLASLPDDMWSVPGERTWWNLQDSVTLNRIGYANATLEVDLATMLAQMQHNGDRHGGLITLGDHNWDVVNGTAVARYDQKWISSVREPIKEDWIVGKARGELPWFGLLKLYATGTVPDDAPRNSLQNLVITLGAIVIIPIALDIAASLLKRRGNELFGWTKKLSPRYWRGSRKNK